MNARFTPFSRLPGGVIAAKNIVAPDDWEFHEARGMAGRRFPLLVSRSFPESIVFTI